ncbi:protein of unknown function [Chitinophaga jiangningensis]|uniref:DUF4421 domain-containing protein n=1 Tax=Chitinophaga jiangningensis TaxID=1419482 RepID=A0A1M7A6W4_9BACT|nr:DUF4421 family protein [Chitinophaga jiangningensis]SHL38376.1 protein of unknown function [Chitinophaga jiangningensis]
MLKKILVLLLTMCTLVAFSQEPHAVKHLRDSTPNIAKMDEWLTVKLSQSTDVEKLAVITPTTEIRLSPNAASVTRLGVSYRFLSASYSYIPRFIPGNNDDAEKGKTKGGSFSAGISLPHWMQELSYSRVKGYYLENTSDFNPDWTPGKPYIQFPDLVFTQFEGMTAYKFNADFSANAILTQSERQLKSAGSFVPRLLYRYYINNDKSTPTPGGFTQKGKNLELLIGAGYYYNFIIRERFYAALGLAPGAGYIFSWITTRAGDGTTAYGSQQNFIFRLDGLVSIGYNGPRLFAGAYTRIIESAFRQERSQVITEDDRVMFQVVLGYRFKAPRLLKAGVDKLESKMPKL